MRTFANAAALAAALALAATATAAPAKVGYPGSVASTGDSITRALHTGLPLFDVPANSWSTGTNGAVASHYGRILAASPAIAGKTHNDARTSARVAELPNQAATAAGQRVDYLTILMGANDVCRSSEAAMTPVADFRAGVDAALARFTRSRPDARVYVVSIPDVYRLWEVHRLNFIARLAWDTFDICQAMLANPGSTAAGDEARRQRVRARVVELNAQLAQACAAYVHCRWDDNAAFNTSFLASDVSGIDFFHPSLSGQAKLAQVSWSAGFDFTDAVAPTSTAALTSVSATGATVTVSASDGAGVAGVEYRLGQGVYRRYTAPVRLIRGRTLTYRAVDVNGNVEATKTVSLPLRTARR